MLQGHVIDANQLGRRNLTPDLYSLLRGRRYNRTKKPPEANLKQNAPTPHFEGSVGTAESLAKQHGVSRATIERDGQFARAVETVKAVEPEIEAKVVSTGTPTHRAPKAS